MLGNYWAYTKIYYTFDFSNNPYADGEFTHYLITRSQQRTRYNINCSPLDHSLQFNITVLSPLVFSRGSPATDQVNPVVSMLKSPLPPMYKQHFLVCGPNAFFYNEDLFLENRGSTINKKQIVIRKQNIIHFQFLYNLSYFFNLNRISKF